MDTFTDLLPLIATMLLTGVAAGILAGLLGVGGGIVIVPVLDTALQMTGVSPDISMHIAVATSLATIVPTSISSSRAHHRRQAVDLTVARLWGPWIFAGSILGTVVASRVAGDTLSLIFACMAMLVALKMVIPVGEVQIGKDISRNPFSLLIPAFIGCISSMMGIGGGTLSVPALSLMNQVMHRAVGTAALFGLFISLPGAASFIITGWADPRMPFGNLGYVSLIGFMMISPATVLAAPLGARLAHRLSPETLRIAFGAFLLIVASRMLYRTLVV